MPAEREKTRQGHVAGATRLHADGSYIVSGGSNGKVSIYSSSKWHVKGEGASLWSGEVHDGAVNSVVVNAKNYRAFTAGRDGAINMIDFKQSVADGGKTEPVRYALCKTTGEIRFVATDESCTRVVMAGDSLRILTLPDGSGGMCGVCNLPLTISHPIISVSWSACSQYLAVANSSKDVAVYHLPSVEHSVKNPGGAPAETQQAGTSTQLFNDATESRQQGVKVLNNILSPTFSKNENVVLRMCFHRNKDDALILAIPAIDGVRVIQVVASATTPGNFDLRTVGTIVQDTIKDVSHVQLFQNTRKKYNALVGTVDGVIVHLDAIDVDKFTSKEKASWRVRESDGELCECGVDAATGNLFYSCSSGSMTMLKEVLPFLKTQAKKQKEAETQKESALLETTQKQQDGINATKSSTEEADTVPEALKKAVSAHASTKNNADGRESSADDVAGSNSDGSDEEEEDDDDENSEASTTSEGSENLDEIEYDLMASNPDYDPAAAKKQRRSKKSMKEQFRIQKEVLVDMAAEEDDDEDDEGYDSERELRLREYDGRQGEEAGMEPYHGDDDDEEDEEGEEEGDAAPGRALGAALNSDELRAYQHAAALQASLDYCVQPGCTNPDSKTGNHFLAYNSIGAVMRTSPDAVQVVFHDMAKTNYKLGIADSRRAISAALSVRGAVFALRSMDEEEAQSLNVSAKSQEIYVRHFEFPQTNDFRTTLPALEEIRCLAAGQNFVCVVTNLCMRFFSYTGLEIYCMVPPHNVVAVVGMNVTKWSDAAGRDSFSDPLAVVTVVGNQHFLRIWDVSRRSEELRETALPVSLDNDNCPCQVQWLGWSEDGSFYVADSYCVVRKLHHNFGASWLPVFDSRAHVAIPGMMWPWAVNNDALMICVSVQDEVTQAFNGPAAPTTATLPTNQRIDLKVCFLKNGSEEFQKNQHALAKKMFRADDLKKRPGTQYYTTTMAEMDRSIDEELLKQYLNARNNGNIARAADLLKQFNSSKLLEKLLKSDPDVTRNKLYSRQLIDELERRKCLKNKRVCDLPAAVDGLGGMNDKQREALLSMLWAREGEGLNEEAKQKKMRSGLGLTTSVEESRVAAPAVIPNSSLYAASSSSASNPAPALPPASKTILAQPPAKSVLKDTTNNSGSAVKPTTTNAAAAVSPSATGASGSKKSVGFAQAESAKKNVEPLTNLFAVAGQSTQQPAAVVQHQAPPAPAPAPVAAQKTVSNPFAAASKPGASPTAPPSIAANKPAAPKNTFSAANKKSSPGKQQTQLKITTTTTGSAQKKRSPAKAVVAAAETEKQRPTVAETVQPATSQPHLTEKPTDAVATQINDTQVDGPTPYDPFGHLPVAPQNWDDPSSNKKAAAIEKKVIVEEKEEDPANKKIIDLPSGLISEEQLREDRDLARTSGVFTALRKRNREDGDDSEDEDAPVKLSIK